MDSRDPSHSLTYVASGTAKLAFENITTNPNNMVTATDENYLITGGFELAEGQNFTADDVHAGRNYTILGNETRGPFGEGPAVGKSNQDSRTTVFGRGRIG